jgi:hypothetical protein
VHQSKPDNFKNEDKVTKPSKNEKKNKTKAINIVIYIFILFFGAYYIKVSYIDSTHDKKAIKKNIEGKEFKHLKTFPVKSTKNKTSIKQPQGWDVQYLDASCIVTTYAEGETKETSWRIKMGYLAGDQLIFMFSVYNSGFKDLTTPKKIKAFLLVDNKSYKAIGFTNQSGELVLPVENSIKLQGSLSSAKSVGIKVQINSNSR